MVPVGEPPVALVKASPVQTVHQQSGWAGELRGLVVQQLHGFGSCQIGKKPPLEKKVKDRTYYWCKHHMCWGGHKEKECKKGMERTAQQNDGRSTYAASAASATVGNSDWNNLLANMHRNMADE